MSFKSDIENLVEKNFSTYRDNSDRFIADYNRELELTNEYNGRQLLELLQNADDAESKEVEITWNKSNQQLQISNKGKPFSEGGIKSLMLANFSPKTKTSYIGNKGLGFRSILNWADGISIFANNCKISFSPAIAKQSFEQLGLTQQQKEKIQKERNLSANTIPFPVLAIPEVIDLDEGIPGDWTTTILLNYRQEYESDIGEQLDEIQEEILLFLNSIDSIKIIIDDKIDNQLSRERTQGTGFENVCISDKKWRVFKKEDVLPDEFQDKAKNEKQSYSLKVALQPGLSDHYNKLFNYFPTQVSVHLPCIIHGTFELSSSRNHLNDSKRNKFILEELVELLKGCAIFLTKEDLGWLPYLLLTPKQTSSDSKLIANFYSHLENERNSLPVCPCIDGKYRKSSEVTYYTEEFSEFCQKHFSDDLPELLISMPKQAKEDFNSSKYHRTTLIEKIENIGTRSIPDDVRAELIVQLTDHAFWHRDEGRFSLLTDDEGNVIDKENGAFTPVIKADAKFQIPSAVKIAFMNTGLYDSLLSRLEKNFDKKEPKSRELQRAIKGVVNLQPYDSNNVIERVITGIKEALQDISNEADKAELIKEMVQSLFSNFKHIDNRQDKVKLSVPLISKTLSIVDANELFLSATYPNGKIVETIYLDAFNDESYLTSIDYWGFEGEEQNLLEEFFLWLGVNRFSKTDTQALKDVSTVHSYMQFVFAKGTDKPPDFTVNRMSKDTRITRVVNMSDIAALSPTNIVLLAAKDPIIRRHLEINEERIDWNYNYGRQLTTEFSFIRYQFISTEKFTKYVIEDSGEDIQKLINEDFDIDYETLGQFGVSKSEARTLLTKLGAKETFSDLSALNIYDIIASLPEKDKSGNGRGTQTIYKMALDALVQRGEDLNVPESLLLFARKGNEEHYLPNIEIYYSDNTLLPQKILNTLPVLNLSKRSGEDNVEKYFGVKSLREFKISVDETSLRINECNSEFAKYFESIKPYLLCYRINKLKADNTKKKEEARVLKNCTIEIVSECSFSFGTESNLTLEEKQYINIKNKFYFRHSATTSVTQLKHDSIFCDAFAEMMCIIFKANDLKNEFRQILRNDLPDTIHLAGIDLGDEKQNEAFLLLGVSRAEINFWQHIFSLKGKKLEEPIEDTDKLVSKIQEGLGFNLPDNYGENLDLDSFATIESIELLKLILEKLNLDVKAVFPIGLSAWHKAKIKDALKDRQNQFRNSLWLKLKEKPPQQREFLNIMNRYNYHFLEEFGPDIESIKHNITPAIEDIVLNRIEKHFDIKISDKSVNIVNLYKRLLSKYTIEETDLSDEQIRSLLFFGGNDELIEAYLISQFPESHNEEEEKSEEPEVANIIEAFLMNDGVTVPANGLFGSNGTWLHSGFGEQGKKRKGRNAELLVYNSLVDKYGAENVKWVSGNSPTPDKNDQLHYDMEYKDTNGVWRLVEVKSMSGDYIIISKPEVDKGLSESTKFELALVKNGVIYLIKDIFQFSKSETFENNTKFIAQPKEYLMSFKVKN